MTKEPLPDDPPKKEKAGFINDLAQRSAGLSDPTPPPRTTPDHSAWKYAGIGLQFAATTAIFAFMGLYVDRHWGTTPWGLVGLTTLGFAGGLYLLIKDALRANAEPDKKHQTKDQPR